MRKPTVRPRRQKLELPIIEYQEEIGGEIYTIREPNTFGAKCNWGQIEDNGATMLIAAEIDDTEIEKIPRGYRRGQL